MHTSTIHRIIALAMCAVLIFSLAACGKTPSAPGNAPADTDAPVLDGTPAPTATPLPVAPVNATPSASPTSSASPSPSPTAEPNGIPEPNATETPKRSFEEWKKINSDVVGWVKIADTKIDYPVVLGKDNEYYLSHGPDKKSSKSGACFLDYRNADETQRQHLIIYGHNMRNGTQFNNLNLFKDKAFFDKHPSFTFRFNDEEYECAVFSAYVTTLDIVFTHVKFGSQQNFVTYMGDLKKQSKYANDVKIKEKDRVLTLVTCTYEYDNSRYVVHARMTKKK